jgi:hypothetical protein
MISLFLEHDIGCALDQIILPAMIVAYRPTHIPDLRETAVKRTAKRPLTQPAV